MSGENKTFPLLSAQEDMTAFYDKTISKLDEEQALELWGYLLWKMINENKVSIISAYGASNSLAKRVLMS